MSIYIGVKTQGQLNAALHHKDADAIILPPYLADAEHLRSYPNVEFWSYLPEVLRENRSEQIKAAAMHAPALVVNNIDTLGLLKEIDHKGNVMAGEMLYSYNSEAICFYKKYFPEMKFMAPAELTDEEIFALEERSGVKFIYKVYGRQLLMITAQKLNGKYKDEKGECFEGVFDKEAGLSRIYGGKPVSMLNKKEVWEGRDILLDFTVESEAETEAILKAMSVSDFTRGHHFRGID